MNVYMKYCSGEYIWMHFFLLLKYKYVKDFSVGFT